MAKVGQLFVSLGLDTINFTSGIIKAKDLAFANSKEIQRSMELIGKATVGAGATAAAALAVMVKQQINVADQAFKMSQKFGISVESFTGFSHAANLAGVESESLGKGLQHLSKWMVENGQGGRNVKEVLFQVADSYQKMGEGALRSADAQKKFGKAGADLIPMLKDGRAGLQGAWQEAERLGLVISTKTGAAAELFNDNLTRLQVSLKGVASQIMAENIVALSGLSSAFVNIRGDVARAGGELLDGFLPKLLIVDASVRGTADNLINVSKGLALSLAGMASGNMGLMGAGTAALAAPEGRAQRIQDVINFMLESRKQIEDAMRGIGAKAGGFTDPNAAEGIKKFITALREQAFTHGMTTTAINLHKAALLGITDPKILNDIKNLSVAMENFGGKAISPKRALPPEMAAPELGLDPALLAQFSKLPTIFGEIRNAAASVKPPLSEMNMAMRDFSQFGLSAIGDAVLGLTSWKNVANQIISDLGRMLWHALVLKPLMGSLFGFGGGGGGVNLGSVGGLPIASIAGVGSFAGGGDFGPRQMITVGERGPELLFTGNQSGTVIPNGKSAGGGVTQNIVINAPGAELGTVARLNALMMRQAFRQWTTSMAERARRTV